MDNVSREMEILRKNQKEMLGNRNAVIEMKNTFDGLISKVYITQEKNLWAWGDNNANFQNWTAKVTDWIKYSRMSKNSAVTAKLWHV